MQGAKNRVVAAILALFVGGLGVHHFYLGNFVLGAVYLIFSWTFIPALIAIVEAIMMFVMSDEAFAEKYGQGPPFSASREPVMSVPGGRDTAAQLSDWAKLRDSGAITDEEYEAKKRELLNS